MQSPNWSIHTGPLTRVIFVLIIVLAVTVTGMAPAVVAGPADAQSPYAVGLDGDVAVVGAPWQDGYAGSAYVLRRSGEGWRVEQTLSFDGGGRFDRFGNSVAIDGDYIAVGAPWNDLFRGAVHVFKRDGREWKLEQTLTAGNAAPDTRFGAAIEFDGGALVVGAGDRNGSTAAWRFELRDGRWTASGRDDNSERADVEGDGNLPEADALEVIDLVGSTFGPPPPPAVAAGDSLEWVSASDGTFEEHVEIKWSPVEADAIIYKILRDGALISVASSEDSLHHDTSAVRGATYDYCVVVQYMAGGEGSPRCDTGSRIIRAPEQLSASDGTFVDGVHLRWEDRSTVEDGFYLERDGALIATIESNTRYYVDETADTMTVYGYAVIAFDNDGGESAPDTDTGFRGVVLPPLNVEATDGEFATSVRVTWLDQGDESGFMVTRVNLANLDSTVITTTAMDVQEHFDDTAQPGIRYRYCVLSLDAFGRPSVPGCDDGGIDLAFPTSVAASDSTFDDRVQLTWEDESGLADGYHIWRDGAPLDTVGTNVRLYNDHDAQEDMAHTYCVLAYNDNGGVSAPVCDDGFRMIVLAPENVSASAGDFENRTEVRWESSSTTVALFKIYRDGVFIKSMGAGARVYSDEGGTAGADYVYGVQAVTGFLDVSTTPSDAGRRELKAPINVAATDDEFEERVEISWRDLSNIETGFVIYRTADGSAVTDTIGETGSNTSSFVDRTGEPGTTYLYQIAAYDIEGEARGESDPGDGDEGIRSLLRPIGVEATDGEFEDRVEITWSDESNAEDGYRVFRDGLPIGDTEDNVTSTFDMAPPFGVVSEYRVRAFDLYGTSNADADSGFTTILAPASLNASDTYEDRIELRWVDVSEVEAGYVLVAESMGVTLRVDTLPAGATYFTDTAAASNVTYDYRLWAFAGAAASTQVQDTGIRPVTETTTEITELDIKLKSGAPDSGDYFGMAVAIDGGRAVVGVRYDDDNLDDAGAVYVFAENPDHTWSQEDKLLGGDRLYEFGSSVAIAGDLLVVGTEVEGEYVGTVSFFVRNTGGAWALEDKVWASDGNVGSSFGFAVAIEGDVAIVGSPGHDYFTSDGKAYIFQRHGGSWDEMIGFKAGDPVMLSDFGKSVAISGDRVVVGAPGPTYLDNMLGSAYVFSLIRDGSGDITGVIQEEKLTAGTYAELGDNFGRTVGIAGDLVVVGIQDDTTSCAGKGPGAAYVFRRDAPGTTWSEETRLTASDGSECDLYGDPVAIHDERIVVGSRGGIEGSAYIYDRGPDGEWTEKGKLVTSDGTPLGGGGVGISDDRLIVGAPYDRGNSLNEGSAYILYLVLSPGYVAASDGTVEGYVHVQWHDRSVNEEGFIIYRDGVEYATVGADVAFYDDVEAEPGRTYEYTVTAYNGTMGFESVRVSDFGWRPPDGHITGRVTAQNGAGVENVSLCLEPPPTRALLFDGAGGHVRIPEDGTFNFAASDDFTVEVWFSYAGSDRSPRLISKLALNETDERPLDLGLQRSGRLFFTMSDGTEVARVLSQRNDMADDRWHHVACVHDGASHTLTLYIDGVEEDAVSSAPLGDITNNQDIYIGGFEENSWFGGQLDELRVWDTARTLVELAAASSTPLQGDEDGLAGYWPFDAFSGAIVTDFADDAQYGVFVGGVYRTDHTAPLDVCGRTDGDGNYVLTNIRYAENGTDFRVRPSLGERQFSPAVQTVTLNRGHPVENQVVFSDISSHEVSGLVQFAGTNCFQPDVEIRIDNAAAAVTDKNGKFSIIVTHESHTFRARFRDYSYRVVFQGDTLATDSVTIDVTDDIRDLVFINDTTYPVSGKAGGGCNTYIGEVSVRFRSENNCLDTTFVGNPGYAIDLPPMKYFASATIDRETIPESLVRPDVIEFFQNLGEREVNLLADTDSTVIDDTMDFIYRAPLRVTITGFEPFVDPACPQLQLEDGTLLPPGLPVIPQEQPDGSVTEVELTILVEETYGNSTCPLDTGMVVIIDEIADRENQPDTVAVSNGVATYTTRAVSPSLVRGRTEGTTDRSFQKALTVKTLVEGRTPKLETEWVLVKGHIAPEGAEFITSPSNPFPLFVLRDPPGDGSYAYIEKGVTGCARISWTNWKIGAGAGVEFEFLFGGTSKIWTGFGAGIIEEVEAHTILDGKLLIGATLSQERTHDICVTTTERLFTSPEEDFVGGEADIYVGAGFTFLFTEVGVIDVNDGCVVEQTSSIAFEPQGIETAFAFTERHITDILMPELESKIAYYHEQGDQASEDEYTLIWDAWERQLEYNRNDKICIEDTLSFDPVVTSPRDVENASFSAGVTYEYSREEADKRMYTWQVSSYVKGEGRLLTNFGLAKKFEWKVGIAVETNNEWIWAAGLVDTNRTWKTGYVINDDDIGDNFTVDIVSTRRWGTIFDVQGGRSSCPYEPWLGLETDEAAMVRRDNPQLFIDPKQRFGVDPDDVATFKLTIANMSDERRDYVVKPVSNSNPGGAIMRLNGAPITDHPVFYIDGLGNGVNSHEATLEVERGPSRFAYERLALVIEPVCGGDAFAQRIDLNTIDSVFFDVYFDGCSDITLRGPDVEPGWTYNRADSAAGKKLDVVLDGYQLVVNPVTPNLLEAVGIQYRYMGDGREGPGPWVDIGEIPPGVDADISSDGSPDTIMVWQPDSLANGAYDPLVDGVYELRAFTVCSTGGRGYSNVTVGTIDRHAPVVFGAPQPSDGELSLGELIGVTFNEPIDCASVEDAAISLEYADGPLAGQSIPITPVCNGETIYLVPQVDAADLDGRRLEASVGGVADRVGNTMTSPVTWQFDYRQSLFTWSETRITREVALVTPGSVPAELVNGTAIPVDYEVTGRPGFFPVSPANASGRLAPGASCVIDFVIDPVIAGGIHEGQVTVQAVDTSGVDTVAVAVLDVVLDVSCAAPDWAIDAGDFEYSMSIVARVGTDDGTLTGNGDLVAAFVGEQLRGLASPRDVAGDTLVFLTVFSNRVSGETARFEVWDDDKCKRYGSTAERAPFLADDVLGTTLSPMILTALNTLPGSVTSFPLYAGWNWFSTNVVSADMTVGSVLSSLAPAEGDVIKSKTAFAVFDPDTSIGWVGTLTTLDNTSGYMVRLTDAGTILQEGNPVDPAAMGVPVDNGWNWIGYLPNSAGSVGGALADLVTQGLLNGNEVVKSQADFAEWNAGWFGSLETMQPGSGYRLYLQDPALPSTFNYPGNTAAASVALVTGPLSGGGESPSNGPGWDFDPGAFEYNMTMVATVRDGGIDWSGSDKFVGAFVGDQCRGVAALMPVPGIGGYLAFVMIHGDEASGETVSFRAFDASAETAWSVTETMAFSANATNGTVRDPVVLTPSSRSDGEIPSEYRLAQNRPNPFNPVTTIQFDLPQPGRVVLSIYNVAGQRIQRVVDQDYPAGSHTVVWNGRTSSGGDAASGVYFYHIKAGSFVDVRKMVLLR